MTSLSADLQSSPPDAAFGPPGSDRLPRSSLPGGAPPSDVLDSLRSQDPEAWGRLFVDDMPAIYRFVRSRLGDQFESEDVTSEVFERAWRAANTLKDRGVPPRAWLYGIARHVISSHRRRSLQNPQGLAVRDDDASESDPSLSPERVDLARAIARLGHKYGEIITLRFFHGLSVAEVALALGLSFDAVKGRQARALAALRADLLQA